MINFKFEYNEQRKRNELRLQFKDMELYGVLLSTVFDDVDSTKLNSLARHLETIVEQMFIERDKKLNAVADS